MNELIYIASAGVGGVVLLLQLALMLLGGDADFEGDFDEVGDTGDGGLNLLSLRAIAGFLTFFGIVGWWGATAEWGDTRTLLTAIASGTASMFGVASLFSLQRKLDTRGNINFENVVGRTAKVYLRIPGENNGIGKITVAMQGRSVEFPALTMGPTIATGADVKIVSMTSPGTYEVTPL